jgi:ABC-type Fe3+/spermidine/putrescine transport system ATPase subunit
MSIQLEQVSKTYAGRAAISDVSVDIEEGEFFVLLGPSGSGKSTLLRAIAGLTSVDRGRIVLHGKDVTRLNARLREVGFVFQNYALFRHMTVADNIEFALRARRVPAAVRKRRRNELLRLVALEGFEQRLPSQLSGGQQQRVAVARSLAHEPRVLLLDEPFGALDARIREDLRRAIRAIQREIGISTILVTHDQEEAFSMADRIGVMDHGRLLEVGEPRALYRSPATRFVANFLGTANLLLGRCQDAFVNVGDLRLLHARQTSWVQDGDEATVVFRPEDFEIALAPEQLSVPALGAASVAELQFVGSIERLGLDVAATDGLRSAVNPAASSFRVETSRPASEATVRRVNVGDRVWIGCKNHTTLPTPLSSIHILSESANAGEALAETSLVRDLAKRMQIRPVVEHAGGADGQEELSGLAVTSMRDVASMLDLVQRGAKQVLAVDEAAEGIEQMLIWTDGSVQARSRTLATASSLARHLTLEVTMLLARSDRSGHESGYKSLLDLRDTALREHHIDIRTETFAGTLEQALASREAQMSSVLLVAGITPALHGGGSPPELTAALKAIRPGALLVVAGRSPYDRAKSRLERYAVNLRAVQAGAAP